MSEKARVPVAELEWALSYNGYQRLARGPHALFDWVIAPARREFDRTGSVPTWCGVDLLRGWLYYLQREDQDGGMSHLGSEWISVAYAILDHPHADPSDRPPTIFGRVPHVSNGGREPYPHQSNESVTNTFDIRWRGRRVGTLVVGETGVEYVGSTAEGFARLIMDALIDESRRGSESWRAAQQVLDLVASVPETEFKARLI